MIAQLLGTVKKLCHNKLISLNFSHEKLSRMKKTFQLKNLTSRSNHSQKHKNIFLLIFAMKMFSFQVSA